MTRARRAALPAVCLAVCLATPAPAQVNTGQDASKLPFVACNGRVGFRTSEIQQGQTDLTGDGDAFDFGFQTLTPGTGAVVNGQVDASGPLACGGDVFAFGTSEFSEGNADLDADGDATDTVLHVYDAAGLTLVNVGLPVSAVAVSASPFAAFTVPETSLGPLGTDLNGDGDTTDVVLHVYDVAGATVTNVGLDASRDTDLRVAGARVAFTVNEAAQGPLGTDLNGDGDSLDHVVHVYDVGTATLTNTVFAALPGIQLDGDVVAFAVDEAAQGPVSLNADLDTGDEVLHLYCLPGAACGPGIVNVNTDASRSFVLAGDVVALRTSERNQLLTSLNPPDGDTSDAVVQVYRISTATLTNTALASEGELRVAGDTIAIGVPEKRQNRQDLDGDGDNRDVVLHLWDAATSTATNTGLALNRKRCAPRPGARAGRGPCMDARDDVLVFAVSERDTGFFGTDLDGDGDTKDAVAFVRRLSTGATTGTGLAVHTRSALVASDTLGAFRISEKAQNAILNGDSDGTDFVQGVADAATGTVTNLARATEEFFLMHGRSVAFRVPERGQNAFLNADGDKVDAVLHYANF
jgi:hypothetical protein